MTEEQELMEWLLEQPASTTRRTEAAHFYRKSDPDRAEFILGQLHIAHVGAGIDPETAQRTRNLELQHRERWAGPLATMADGWTFHRGCIEQVTMSGGMFLEHGPALMRTWPIRSLSLTRASPFLMRLSEMPELRKLVALHLDGNGLTDGQVQSMAGSPFLENLRYLSLRRNPLQMEGLRAVVRALPYLEVLETGGRGTETPDIHPVYYEDVVGSQPVDWEPSAAGAQLMQEFGKRAYLAGNPRRPVWQELGWPVENISNTEAARAEFGRLTELASTRPLSGGEEWRRRCILHQYRRWWAGAAGRLADRFEIGNGFPEEVEMTAFALIWGGWWLEKEPRPIRHLRLKNCAGQGEAAGRPRILAYLVSLDLSNAGLDDENWKRMQAGGRLSHLAALNVEGNPLGRESLAAIWKDMPNLRYLRWQRTAVPWSQDLWRGLEKDHGPRAYANRPAAFPSYKGLLGELRREDVPMPAPLTPKEEMTQSARELASRLLDALRSQTEEEEHGEFERLD
jgi:hypothetical protein